MGDQHDGVLGGAVVGCVFVDLLHVGGFLPAVFRMLMEYARHDDSISSQRRHEQAKPKFGRWKPALR